MLVSAAFLALLLTEAAAVPAADGAVAHPPQSRTFVGEVLKVDVPNRQVVMVQGIKAQGKKGEAPREVVTVHVPFTTRVQKGKKAATLTDVKAHDHAVVRYRVTAAGPQALSLQVALVEPAPGVPGS